MGQADRSSGSRRRRLRLVPLVLLLGLGLQLAGCSGDGTPSMLDPHGPGADRIAGIWWFLLWTSVAVFLIVAGLIGYAAWRRRGDAVVPRSGGEWIVVAGGIVLPAIVLTVVWLVNLNGMSALAYHGENDLTVQVTGHQYWWEVRYPGAGFVTANELHIPIGRRVRLELTSADVNHSFWVPQLTYKTDLIPGKTNVTWLQADRAGSYDGAFRGQCAEYCGLQHAKMEFLVVAEPVTAYDAWVAEQQRPATAAAPAGTAAARGLNVLEHNSCAACHALRGTSAAGTVGPDLTHFGERRTLGAGTAPNNRGYLGGWIVNAQTLKPGNKMPTQQLDPQDLQDVLAYFDNQREEASRGDGG